MAGFPMGADRIATVELAPAAGFSRLLKLQSLYAEAIFF
jgi:hypothetical protein